MSGGRNRVNGFMKKNLDAENLYISYVLILKNNTFQAVFPVRITEGAHAQGRGTKNSGLTKISSGISRATLNADFKSNMLKKMKSTNQ